MSPRLRRLGYLHRRRDSSPAGTTLAGTGLTPAGTLRLSTAHLGRHTAYSYTANNQITQLWQKTGAGVRLNNDAAIGPDGKVYSLDATTLVELDPATGAVLRSLSGQNFCGSNAPLISEGYLWTFSATQTLVYDLDTFTLAATLNDSPGNNLRTLRSLGALSDNYLVLERGEGSSYPRLVVYGPVPEPASLALLGLGALGLLTRRKR